MEEAILQWLRQSQGHSFSVKEISKTMDRQQFRQDPNWARPLLQRLLGRGIIEKDKDGRYLVPVTDQNGSSL